METSCILTNTLCCSQNCQNILNTKEHILLGISPFNSYYTESSIYKLISWAKENFDSFHIFIPDTLPVFNFLALGYDKEKAEKKANKQARYLKNKVIRAFKNLGYSEVVGDSLIIDMKKLEENEYYKAKKERCYKLYHEDSSFHAECLAATVWILNGYKGMCTNAEIATHYLLQEMPLFLNTPEILNVSSSLFCYHQTPNFINYLYNIRNRELPLSLQQGFIEINFNEQPWIQGENLINEINQ